MEPYVFVITRDHLSGPDGECADQKADLTGQVRSSAHDVNGWAKATAEALKAGRRVAEIHPVHAAAFRLWDDDGILYFSGRLYWRGDTEPSDETLTGLFYWSQWHSGTTRLSFPAHKEWEIS